MYLMCSFISLLCEISVGQISVCLLACCLFVVPLSYKQNLVHPKHYELLAKNTSIIFLLIFLYKLR